MSHASIQTIDELLPIEGADRIELAKLGNYQTVVQKDRYSVGDKVVFVSADAVLPTEADATGSNWAESYLEYAPRRVKIIKLRGVFSEGIVVPANEVLNEALMYGYGSLDEIDYAQMPLDDILRIKHFDPPVPQISGAIAGRLPSWLPKTDAERWENVWKEGEEYYGALTEKVDGTSATFALDPETLLVRVFSRNMELDYNSNNIYTRVMKMYAIDDVLARAYDEHGIAFAVRGEIFGEGIQSRKTNPHSKLPLDFAMFSILDIDSQVYRQFDGEYMRWFSIDIPTVQYFGKSFMTTEKAEEHALHEGREGYVLWPTVYDTKPIKILCKPYDASK